MELVGTEGNELRLSIVGYRYPDRTVDPWDSNALMVAVRVVSAHGTWEVVDPCLTTWEAVHLASWLTAVALFAERGPASLAAPNLALWARPADGRVQLRACFELERRPPWASSVAGGGDLCVDLDVGVDKVLAAASALRDDLSRFPQRGDDPTL